jgi:hypothetical protein
VVFSEGLAVHVAMLKFIQHSLPMFIGDTDASQAISFDEMSDPEQ